MGFKRYFYDTEFFERGNTYPIEPISIGIKCQAPARRYYAVFNDFDLHSAWHYRSNNGEYWLRENVLRQLPLRTRDNGKLWLDGDGTPMLDSSDVRVKSTEQIRQDLEEFFEIGAEGRRELWAWYADYDHVVLSQIWGAMIKLPRGMPMFTHDLKQVVDLAGNPPMPRQVEGHHNALQDAEHVEVMWDAAHLMGLPVMRRPEFDPPIARPIRDTPQA